MLTIALDTGPVHGSVTGVGRSVIELLTEFEQRTSELTIVPYVLSFRAPLTAGTRRLHLPAGLALRAWGRADFPRVDRTLSDAQVIHGTNYVVPPSDRPRLVTVHDCWALRHPEHCSAAVNLSMRVLRRVIARGAHVHVPSQATADSVYELFPAAAVTVVPWAAPRIHDAPGLRPADISWSEHTPFIVSVSTIDHRKNLVRLVSAFAAIASDHTDLRLVLAGNRGNATRAVETAIASLPAPIRCRIQILESLRPDEISWLYRHAIAVAYPSLDEGFGFPLLEAMAAGTPVVAADSGSLPEIAGCAALLVDPTDTDALADALMTVLGDEVRRSELVAAGHRRVEDFSWSATADGLIDLYRALAVSPSAGRRAARGTRE